MSLFTMPNDDGLMDEAKEYLKLLCIKEMEGFKRRIVSEAMAMEGEATKHIKLMQQTIIDVQQKKKSRLEAPLVTEPTPTLMLLANVVGSRLLAAASPHNVVTRMCTSLRFTCTSIYLCIFYS